MFRFVKQVIISAMMLFNSLLNVNPLECIAMKNRECKVRSEIVNVNNNPMFYPLSIKINVVAIVIILIIHMQEFVFLML